jgi:pimeloyl-ACP methyl ester carboxylesterase
MPRDKSFVGRGIVESTSRPLVRDAGGMQNLRVRLGGTETPKILLLHGLGATGDVWNGLTDLLGRTAWTAPDLPGHSARNRFPGTRSPRSPRPWRTWSTPAARSFLGTPSVA